MAIMGQLRLPRTTPMATGMSLRQQVKGQIWANPVSLNSLAVQEIPTGSYVMHRLWAIMVSQNYMVGLLSEIKTVWSGPILAHYGCPVWLPVMGQLRTWWIAAGGCHTGSRLWP